MYGDGADLALSFLAANESNRSLLAREGAAPAVIAALQRQVDVAAPASALGELAVKRFVGRAGHDAGEYQCTAAKSRGFEVTEPACAKLRRIARLRVSEFGAASLLPWKQRRSNMLVKPTSAKN